MNEITEKDIALLINCVSFYGNPMTYHGVGFVFDEKCGELVKDIGDTPIGNKPGKLARDLIEYLQTKYLGDSRIN